MASYWCYLVGGVLMISSFFLPGGAARSGWTSYAPLAVLESGHLVLTGRGPELLGDERLKRAYLGL